MHAAHDIGTKPSPAGVLDVVSLRSRHGGDMFFIRQLYELFLVDAVRKGLLLRTARESRDESAAARLVHSLKGTAGAIYAHELRDCCQRAEERLRSDDDGYRLGWVSELGELLEETLPKTIAEVRRTLNSN